jgi:gliding motility-associated-like protein
MSYSLGGPWFTINNPNSSISITNLTQTSYFRAIVKNGINPSDTSSIKEIIVCPVSIGGVISGDSGVCALSNTGELNLTAHIGSVQLWQSSNNGGLTWNNISNTSNSLNYNNLSQTLLYRAEVKSGVCPSAFSEHFEVLVSPATNAGILSGADSVCFGSNSGFFDLSGFTGEVIHWEKSQSGNDPWMTIQCTNDTLYYDNLTETGYYRVLVKSGFCNALYSNKVLLHVSPSVRGGIVTGQSEACSGANSGTVLLSDYSGEIVNWQYSYDFGTTWQDTLNINHTLNYSNLTQTTSFRAKVQSGVCGIDFSEFATIVIHPTPVVSFSFDTVCYTHATNFQNNSSISSGNIVSNNWDFGNGDGNNSFNPIYTYSAHGNYTVKLIVMSNHSCIDSAVTVVTVRPSPTVNFVTQNLCDRDSASFDNYTFTPGGGTLHYLWDFGDNSTSSDQNPMHLYSSAGEYNVKLIANHVISGCADSLTTLLKVFPRVNPYFSVNNVCLGSDMFFQNTSSLESGNASYFWTFGDGNSSNIHSPHHIYLTDGSFNVIITATTNNNCVDTLSKVVTVNPQPLAVFNFNDVCFTDSVHFIDESIYSGSDLSYSWNFGNGFGSSEQSPSYYYSSPGTYLVTLNTISDSLCQSSVSQFVNINALPNVDFTVSNVCLNDIANFQNLTTYQAGSAQYMWEFGNSQASNEINPEVLYAQAGDYSVKLYASINNMCTDSVEKQISIYPLPDVAFNSENVCDGEQSYFYDATQIESGSIHSFTWDFGDGTNSIQQNPVKQYLNPGIYQVLFSVVSNYGCVGSLAKQVTVDYMPIANFIVNNVCDGFPINPINQSYIQSGQIYYDWSFGDESGSILSEPNHLYDNAGFYRLRLSVHSQHGCIDSLIRYVQVYDLPSIYAGEDISISKGDEIQLSGAGGVIYNWFPATNLSNPTIANPSCYATESTTYILQGEDLNGCKNTDTLMIEVIDDFKISPNNIITPDGNGYNDTWKIKNIESYGTCTVNIFDRTGVLVYSKKSYNNDWNGENLNGDILPDGTYYYVIVFEESDVVYKGSVSLLRNR